jgi:hypothetical protein
MAGQKWVKVDKGLLWSYIVTKYGSGWLWFVEGVLGWWRLCEVGSGLLWQVSSWQGLAMALTP